MQTCPCTYSVCGRTADTAAELVLGSSAMPPPSRNMVTAISRLLLHASSICFPTLSLAPVRQKKIYWSILHEVFWSEALGTANQQASLLKHWSLEQFSRCHLSLRHDYEVRQTHLKGKGNAWIQNSHASPFQQFCRSVFEHFFFSLYSFPNIDKLIKFDFCCVMWKKNQQNNQLI